MPLSNDLMSVFLTLLLPLALSVEAPVPRESESVIVQPELTVTPDAVAQPLKQKREANDATASIEPVVEAAAAVNESLTSATPKKNIAAPMAANEACEYNTNWGTLTLYHHRPSGQVIGRYAYQEGLLQGQYEAPQRQLVGQWLQADSGGAFRFKFDRTSTRFIGRWNYFDNRTWRTDWEGVATTPCFVSP